MKLTTPSLCAGFVALATMTSSFPAGAYEPVDTTGFLIPTRAITLMGNDDKGRDLIAVLYDRSELHFSEPSAPRFLFLDREGSVVLGIGGYVKGVLQYDFGGSIDDGSSFVTADIPVPNNPALRNSFSGSANNSTLFLQMLGRTEHFGTYEVYVQTNFTGDGPSGHDLKLKQAYMRLGYLTVGLTNSVFVDGGAGTPVIDDQGPTGEESNKNILMKYTPKLSKHISMGIGIEVPQAKYTTVENLDEALSQRFPDIPVYLQYAWSSGSHIRASAMFRDLSYRNLVEQKNCFRAGWALQLSSVASLGRYFTFYGQTSYGKGYADFINDLSGQGYDLISSPAGNGSMIAPGIFAYETGLQYQPCKWVFFTGVWSQTHLYNQKQLGSSAYKYTNYLSLNAFINITEDLQAGIEYVNGSRHNIGGEHGRANRIGAMVKLDF